MWRKRRHERDDVVERLHRLLARERYDEMLGASAEAVARFPRYPEIRFHARHRYGLVATRGRRFGASHCRIA
jgi:hypothetical protein